MKLVATWEGNAKQTAIVILTATDTIETSNASMVLSLLLNEGQFVFPPIPIVEFKPGHYGWGDVPLDIRSDESIIIRRLRMQFHGQAVGQVQRDQDVPARLADLMPGVILRISPDADGVLCRVTSKPS